MKSNLGISVGLLGAAAYFTGLFGGYVPLLLVVGYILLREQNDWLRWSAVKALLVCLFFSGLSAAIGLLPDLLGCVDSFVSIFSPAGFSITALNRLLSLVLLVVDMVRTVVLLLLGLRALHQGTIRLGKIDQTANQELFG